MLDKQLCAVFGIDEFSQWVIKQLDYIEDQLDATELSSPRYIELKAIYQTLKDVRNAYCEISKQKLEKDITEAKQVIATEAMPEEKPKQEKEPTYTFEMAILDTQKDPSRFYALTHHFDYLCPLDLFPDVSVYGVDVNICVYNFGYKVTIKGYASGERAPELLAAADLTGWGRADMISNWVARDDEE